jgi:hypothetical protein
MDTLHDLLHQKKPTAQHGRNSGVTTTHHDWRRCVVGRKGPNGCDCAPSIQAPNATTTSAPEENAPLLATARSGAAAGVSPDPTGGVWRRSFKTHTAPYNHTRIPYSAGLVADDTVYWVIQNESWRTTTSGKNSYGLSAFFRRCRHHEHWYS